MREDDRAKELFNDHELSAIPALVAIYTGPHDDGAGPSGHRSEDNGATSSSASGDGAMEDVDEDPTWDDEDVLGLLADAQDILESKDEEPLLPLCRSCIAIETPGMRPMMRRDEVTYHMKAKYVRFVCPFFLALIRRFSPGTTSRSSLGPTRQTTRKPSLSGIKLLLR